MFVLGVNFIITVIYNKLCIRFFKQYLLVLYHRWRHLFSHTILVDTIHVMLTFKLLNMLMLLFDDLPTLNDNSWLSAVTWNAVSELTQRLYFFRTWAVGCYSLDHSITSESVIYIVFCYLILTCVLVLVPQLYIVNVQPSFFCCGFSQHHLLGSNSSSSSCLMKGS